LPGLRSALPHPLLPALVLVELAVMLFEHGDLLFKRRADLYLLSVVIAPVGKRCNDV
jgi:hypothetical protein